VPSIILFTHKNNTQLVYLLGIYFANSFQNILNIRAIIKEEYFLFSLTSGHSQKAFIFQKLHSKKSEEGVTMYLRILIKVFHSDNLS